MKKRIYLLFTVTLMTVTAQSQLIVDSLGRAAFATTTNNSYQVNILGTNSGINCTSGTGMPLGTTAINATAYQKNYFEAMAVKGTVYSGSTGDAFGLGVYGLASTQNAGKNIGLYGSVIPHCNGTGLYASSSSYNPSVPAMQAILTETLALMGVSQLMVLSSAPHLHRHPAPLLFV